MPRWFGTSVTSQTIVELHRFGYSSTKVYGASVYPRAIDGVGQVSSKSVMSSELHPSRQCHFQDSKTRTTGSSVNARLLKFVADPLHIKMHRVVCWTWKPFVADRVSEIQSTWDTESWNYSGGKDNPADLLTRGLTCDNLISSAL